MSECRIHYDAHSRRWEVVELSGGRVAAERVVFDVPVGASPNGYLTCSGVLKTDELLGISTTSAVAKTVRVVREKDLPGYVNDKSMLEWCVRRDPGSGAWIVYRQDVPKVHVTTNTLELDCHAISSGCILHCRAEMLLNGATNKFDSAVMADSVKLRTLTVYDQTLHIPLMAMKAIAKAL